jgi:hypothetical protein
MVVFAADICENIIDSFDFIVLYDAVRFVNYYMV